MLLQTRNTGPLTGRRPVPSPRSNVQSPLIDVVFTKVTCRFFAGETLDVGPWTWDIIVVQNTPPSVHKLSG